MSIQWNLIGSFNYTMIMNFDKNDEQKMESIALIFKTRNAKVRICNNYFIF